MATYNPNQNNFGTSVNPVTGQNTPGVTFNAPNAQNPYGSYTTGSGSATLPSNIGINGGSQPTGTPSTIPLGVATSNVPPLPLPTQNQGSSQNATNIQGSMGFLAQPNITNLNQLGDATKVASQNFNTALGLEAGVMNELANFGQRKQALAGEFGIADLTSDLREVKGKYDATSLSYRRAKEEAMNNPNLTADMKSARISEIERKEASQIADIGIDFNLKQGRLTDAKNLMNDQIELELEPLKIKAQYFTSLKNDYKDFLTTAQNRQLDNLARKEERAYQSAKTNAENLTKLKLEAVEKGLSYDLIKNIKSVDDYIKVISENVVASEILDPKVIATSQYKTINSLAPAIRAINDYKTAVKTYGSYEKLNAQGSGELQSAYGDAISAWKTLAGLGALSGADFGLAENVIPAPSLFTRNKKTTTQLDGASKRAITNINQLGATLKLAYPDSATGIDAAIMQSSSVDSMNKIDPLGIGLMQVGNNDPLGLGFTQ